VVSEENSEGNSLSQTDDSIPMQDLSTYVNKVDVLSPLSYLQTLAPPLSHFENLQYDRSDDTRRNDRKMSISDQANVQLPPIDQPILVSSIKATIQPSTSKHGANQSNDQQPVKKESRLKHFFSPIRKKTICPVPVTPPVAPPSIMCQPDVFISNIVPSNLCVNPPLQLSTFKPQSILAQPPPPPSSPTSSFQVCSKYVCKFIND
jgi:hypothetical protein